MASEILWFFNAPDGHYPWEPEGRRKVDQLKHFKVLAAAMDELPYSGALVATLRHEPLILATTLATLTEKFRPLVAVYPGLISPATLANMALSFDDLFGNRLVINIINSETPVMREFGVFLENDERYDMHEEYWSIFKRLVGGEILDHEGRFFKLAQAGKSIRIKPTRPSVPLWFSGSSDAAIEFAGRHAVNYLTFAEPLHLVQEKIKRVREAADRNNREIRIGLRAPLLVRETSEEAWSVAKTFLGQASAATLAARAQIAQRGGKSGGKSVSAQRLSGLIDKRELENLLAGKTPDDPRSLQIAPNLWSGQTILQDGPPTALVGSVNEVVERLQEYESIGVDTFIFSAYPLIEQAYYVAEKILPHLGVQPFPLKNVA
jgi:alkanesulfonate monooxygenase